MSRIKLFIPIILFLILAAFLFVGLGKNPEKLPSLIIGKPLPEFQLPSLESGLTETVQTKDLIGEPFLLNIWATWCATCLIEHPYLYQLKQQGIKIVGVSYMDDNQAALEWLEKNKDPYFVNVIDAKGRLGFDLGVTGAPETYLVNAEGKITYRHLGAIDQKVWDRYFKQAFPETIGEQNKSTGMTGVEAIGKGI